jgi:hypothetical protein
MVRDELLSFRQHFWPILYPIEARYYEFGTVAPSRTFMTRRIGTPEELRAFQEELTRRESLHEWGFLAYYESRIPPLMGEGQADPPSANG